MRWLVFEFYDFRELKFEGLIQASDFEAIEDDVLFIIHKKTVYKEVYETLLILTRLLNNQEDKKFRMKLKDIKQYKNPLFPFAQDVVIQANVDQDTHYNTIRIETNPIYDKICEVAKKYK